MSLGYKKMSKAHVRDYFRRLAKEKKMNQRHDPLRKAQDGYKYAVGDLVSFVGIGGQVKVGVIELLSTIGRYEIRFERNKLTHKDESELTPFEPVNTNKAQGQRLDGDNLQDVLDAGVNAWRVGRQQFFTPNDLARTLMLPLPMCRASFVDFQMGGGALLSAAINSGTEHVYGVDIDSRLARKPSEPKPLSKPQFEPKWNCVNADLTKFYALLQEIDWRFDLCGLNPPFGVRWHKENLIGLVDSQCDAVRETFGSGRKPTIDSVLATYLIALDRMTDRGEGFVMCSEASARKLMETPAGAHVWLWLTLTDEVATNRQGGSGEPPLPTKGNCVFGKNVRPFDVAVLYFAREHKTRGRANRVGQRINNKDGSYYTATKDDLGATPHFTETLSSVRSRLVDIQRSRQLMRKGLSVYQAHDFCPLTWNVWRAAKEEWLRLQRTEKEGRGDYNIWLTKHGTIGRHLTPFQSWSGKIPREMAESLNRLAGQSPMSLVVQKASRLALLAAVGCNGATVPWRVDPELIAAVERAIAEYNAQRAPFYPLNEVQRLGYLDEEDMIKCKRCDAGLAGFTPGERYALSSETVDIEHHDERLNLLGKPEEITLHGKELAFYIVDALGDRHTFCGVPPDHVIETKGKGRDASVTITAKGESHGHYHDLQMLIRHFEIPQVPDVAQNNPDRYEDFVNQIRAIEDKVNQESRKAGIAA